MAILIVCWPVKLTWYNKEINCIGSFWSKKLHSGPDLQKNCIQSLIKCICPGRRIWTLLYPWVSPHPPSPLLETLRALFDNFRWKICFFLRPKTHILGSIGLPDPTPYLGVSLKDANFLTLPLETANESEQPFFCNGIILYFIFTFYIILNLKNSSLCKGIPVVQFVR